jgi:hypothetical protein
VEICQLPGLRAFMSGEYPATELSQFPVRVRVTLRLAVYRQSVRLSDKPLETHDRYFYPSKQLRLESLCNILTHERMGLSFTMMLGLASAVILGSE